MEKNINKQNILFVFGGEKSSGAEYVMETLIRNYKGAECHLIMSPGNFFNKLNNQKHEYKLSDFKYLRKLNTTNKSKIATLLSFVLSLIKINLHVYRYIKKNNISIVHTNTIVPTTYLLPLVLFNKLFKHKVYFIWSDHDITYEHLFLKKLLPLIQRIYTRTIVVSEAVASKYKNRDRIFVLYNGLDKNKIIKSQQIKKSFRTTYNISEKEVVFGIIGQIVDRKGVNTLIDAFVEFSMKFPKSKLVVAGLPINDNSDYFLNFKRKIAGIDSILYIGFCDDIPFFYNGIDILINNTTHTGQEPLGTTLIEGLAYGKIVMATNVGGSPEIIEDGKNGFLYQDDPIDLLRAMGNVYNLIRDNPEKANLIKDNADIKFQTHFIVEKMLLNYNSLIQSFIKY